MNQSILQGPGNLHVEEVMRAAHKELRELLRQRMELTQRIGSVKRTIVGLASVFGDGLQDDEWQAVRGQENVGRRPGLTKTCRLVLMEADRPLVAKEVWEQVKLRIDEIELRHKEPLASVTTVLNRLVEYGEATSSRDANGRRAWQWNVETIRTQI